MHEMLPMLLPSLVTGGRHLGRVLTALAAAASLPNAVPLLAVRAGQAGKGLVSHHGQEAFGSY